MHRLWKSSRKCSQEKKEKTDDKKDQHNKRYALFLQEHKSCQRVATKIWPRLQNDAGYSKAVQFLAATSRVTEGTMVETTTSAHSSKNT